MDFLDKNSHGKLTEAEKNLTKLIKKTGNIELLVAFTGYLILKTEYQDSLNNTLRKIADGTRPIIRYTGGN